MMPSVSGGTEGSEVLRVCFCDAGKNEELTERRADNLVSFLFLTQTLVLEIEES